MAWMTSRLFLYQTQQDEVVSALGTLLQQGEHRADESLLFGGQAPPLLISPAIDDWLSVSGIRSSFDDVRWVGKSLAKALDCRVLAIELLGTAFRLRFADYRGDSSLDNDELTIPQTGWGLEDDSATDRMPHYQDVEQIAYDRLHQAGIPGDLIVQGFAPLGNREDVSLGQGIELRANSGSDGTDAPPSQVGVDLRSQPFAGDDAPVVIQKMNGDFGPMMVEDRYLVGQPTAAALDVLLTLEEALLERARKALPDENTNRFSLTVTYHAGIYQAELDELLRRNSRHVPPRHQSIRVPWWKFWHYFGRSR